MARKHRRDNTPGDLDFIPLSDAERQEHADALRERAEVEPDLRAEILSEAAEYYAMLGANDLAEQLFREALAAPGAPDGFVHGYYADFLFTQHRAADALDVINQARKLRPQDPAVFHAIGETLLEHDQPEQAARWFTTGLVRNLGELADLELEDLHEDPDLAMLAHGRHQARQTLGLTSDHLDELAEQARPHTTGGG